MAPGDGHRGLRALAVRVLCPWGRLSHLLVAKGAARDLQVTPACNKRRGGGGYVGGGGVRHMWVCQWKCTLDMPATLLHGIKQETTSTAEPLELAVSLGCVF